MIRSETFSTAHLMATCADGADRGLDFLQFGFRSAAVRIYNSCGPRLFYSLQATNATTKMDFLACGTAEVFERAETLSIALRTTSTADAASQPFIGVSAWASA